MSDYAGDLYVSPGKIYKSEDTINILSRIKTHPLFDFSGPSVELYLQPLFRINSQ